MKILAYKKETLKQGLRRPIYSYKKDNKKKKKYQQRKTILKTIKIILIKRFGIKTYRF